MPSRDFNPNCFLVYGTFLKKFSWLTFLAPALKIMALLVALLCWPLKKLAALFDKNVRFTLIYNSYKTLTKIRMKVSICPKQRLGCSWSSIMLKFKEYQMLNFFKVSGIRLYIILLTSAVTQVSIRLWNKVLVGICKKSTFEVRLGEWFGYESIHFLANSLQAKAFFSYQFGKWLINLTILGNWNVKG